MSNVPSFQSLLPESNKIKAIQWLLNEVQNGGGGGNYPPEGGVPKSDLSEEVQTSLDKAENSVSTPEGAGQPGQVLQLDSEGVPAWVTPSAGTTPDSAMSRTSTNAVQNKVISNEFDNYAKTDGYYETLGVGEAKNIIGQTPQDAGFIYRTAGGSSEIADVLSTIKKIQGNVVSLNQLVTNGNLSQGTANWSNTGRLQEDGSIGFLNMSGATKTLHSNIPTQRGKIAIISLAKSTNGNADIRCFTVNYQSHRHIINSTEYEWKKQIYNGELKGDITATGDSGTNLYIRVFMIINFTAIYGEGKEPTTVEQFEADYQRWFGKPLDYEPYNEGTLIPMKMQGIKTVGFNQYNPTTGIVKGLVVDGGYQITGTYTSITQDGVEITPNANGIFTIEKAGDIVVNGGDDTTCVHFVYDGYRNGEYEPYKEHNYNLDVTRVWGKLNGEGSYVQIAPDGLKSATPINSSSDLQNAVADLIEFSEDGVTADIKAGSVNLGSFDWNYYVSTDQKMFYVANLPSLLGIKTTENLVCSQYVYNRYAGYEANDKTIRTLTNRINVTDNTYTNTNSFKSANQGVYLYYELATPLHYTNLMLDTSVTGDGSQLEPITNIRPIVDNYGTEEIIVPASQDSVPSSCNPWMTIQYDINAAEHIDTFEKHGIKDVALHDNLQALCNVINANCSEQLGGTISISAEPNDSLVYSFAFTANAQTQSVSPQNETI